MEEVNRRPISTNSIQNYLDTRTQVQIPSARLIGYEEKETRNTHLLTMKRKGKRIPGETDLQHVWPWLSLEQLYGNRDLPCTVSLTQLIFHQFFLQSSDEDQQNMCLLYSCFAMRNCQEQHDIVNKG